MLLVNNWVHSYCHLLIFRHAQPSHAKVPSQMPAAAGKYKGRLLSPLHLHFWGQDKAGPSTAPIPPHHCLHAQASSLFWAGEPQNQQVALRVCLDEGSQLLYLFCATLQFVLLLVARAKRTEQ